MLRTLAFSVVAMAYGLCVCAEFTEWQIGAIRAEADACQAEHLRVIRRAYYTAAEASRRRPKSLPEESCPSFEQPYFREFLDRTIESDLPAIVIGNADGQKIRVKQKWTSQSALASFVYYRPRWERNGTLGQRRVHYPVRADVALHGIDLTNVVDSDRISLTGLMWLSGGVETFTSAAGAQRTIRKCEPLTLSEEMVSWFCLASQSLPVGGTYDFAGVPIIAKGKVVTFLQPDGNLRIARRDRMEPTSAAEADARISRAPE